MSTQPPLPSDSVQGTVAPDTAPGSAQVAAPAGEVMAKAGSYYRNTRYILALGLLAYGLASIKDGFFKWPRENAEAYQAAIKDPLLDATKLPHSNMDLLFNKVLGVILPPGSLVLLGWALFNSRGVIRLREETLEAPGHKPVPLTMIESVDKRKWERKGIAWVNFRLENGKLDTLKLDDFVYQREPVDEIFKRIEQSLLSPKPKKVVAIPAAPRMKFPPPPPRPRLGGR